MSLDNETKLYYKHLATLPRQLAISSPNMQELLKLVHISSMKRYNGFPLKTEEITAIDLLILNFADYHINFFPHYGLFQLEHIHEAITIQIYINFKEDYSKIHHLIK